MGALIKREAIHALGRVVTSTGVALVAGTGNWTAAAIAVGVCDVSFDASSLIDSTERVVLLTPKITSVSANVVAGSDTDTIFRISMEDDTSTAVDDACDFLVLRVAL